MGAFVEYEIEVDGELYQIEGHVDVHEGEVRSIDVSLCRVYSNSPNGTTLTGTLKFTPPSVMAEVERLVDADRADIQDECILNAYENAMDSRLSARKDGDL